MSHNHGAEKSTIELLVHIAQQQHVILMRLNAMSDDNAAAVAALMERIAKLDADENAELAAVGQLATAMQTALAGIADLKQQLLDAQTPGSTLDLSAAMAALDAIDANAQAATATALAAIPPPV